jgi:hypothetical protein
LAHNHSDAVFTFAIFSQQNSRNLCFQESGLFRDFLHAFLVLKQAAYRKNNDPDRQQNFFYYKLQIRRLKLKGMFLRMSDTQGRKCGGVWGGGSPPQRNDPVGLKLRAVGLKIMRLFTCSALRSKLNIFETRDGLRLLNWKFAQTDQTAQK